MPGSVCGGYGHAFAAQTVYRLADSRARNTQCFGDIPNQPMTMTITADGKKISDYTGKSGDATRLEAKKLSDGRLQLRRLKPYEENVPFTIYYKGVDYIFYTND